MSATIDISTAGQQKAVLEVLEVKHGEKLSWIKFKGLDFTVKVFKGTIPKLVVPLEAGKSAEAVIEVKENEYNGETSMEAILRSFGGEPQRGGGGGGFGGGKQWQPKSSLEIHASCVAGIIKSLAEHGFGPGDVQTWVAEYKAAVKEWAT